jgi:hypothetical protein
VAGVIVRVQEGATEVALLDLDNFRDFVVLLAGVDLATADRLLDANQAGRVTSEAEAVVSVAMVRQLAHRSADPAWNSGLAGMIDYADRNGWLSEDGAYITAHLEFAPTG